MKKQPLGFVVAVDRKEARRPYKVKLYGIYRSRDLRVVRFRLDRIIAEFPEQELAAATGNDYATLHGFPYCYASALHNRQAPSLIWKWYFKEPPIKMLESVFE